MAKNSNLFQTCVAQSLHLIGITLKYVQYKSSKQNIGYYETAVSVNGFLLPVQKYISQK